MENIYMTKNVYENLDLRIVAEVIHLLKEKSEKVLRKIWISFKCLR